MRATLVLYRFEYRDANNASHLSHRRIVRVRVERCRRLTVPLPLVGFVLNAITRTIWLVVLVVMQCRRTSVWDARIRDETLSPRLIQKAPHAPGALAEALSLLLDTLEEVKGFEGLKEDRREHRRRGRTGTQSRTWHQKVQLAPGSSGSVYRLAGWLALCGGHRGSQSAVLPVDNVLSGHDGVLVNIGTWTRWPEPVANLLLSLLQANTPGLQGIDGLYYAVSSLLWFRLRPRLRSIMHHGRRIIGL